jgi:hypothetical protein
MRIYQHTQIGKTLLYPLIGLAGVNFAIAMISPVGRLALVPAIALIISALLFWKLTVTVDNKILRASFGPGLIYKEVPISEVDRCEPMRVRWWHGWGIHLTTNGWLYNVSGRDAVIVTLRNGRRFCVGTDEPQELQAAIRRFASLT